MLNYTGIDLERKEEYEFRALCTWLGTFLSVGSSRRDCMTEDVEENYVCSLFWVGLEFVGEVIINSV